MGFGDVLGKGDTTTVGVREQSPWRGQREGWGAGPWLVVWMVSAELRAGGELCARHPSPTGAPAPQGP